MKKICIKCGLEGHTLQKCSKPVTSFGLIVYTSINDHIVNQGYLYNHDIQYKCAYHDKHKHETKEIYSVYSNLIKNCRKDIIFLLVERKDTIAFINLIQGIYPSLLQDDGGNYLISFQYNKIVYSLIKELTCEERFKLLNFDYDTLWSIAGTSRRNKIHSYNKFQILKSILIETFDNIPCTYIHANYIMPKGRLKIGETPKKCAIREFSEESGYSQNHILLDDNFPEFSEEFVGSDNKVYRNVFFVAKLLHNAHIDIPLGLIKEQSKEVRNIGWFSLKDTMSVIRNSSVAQKQMLYDIARHL